MRRRHFGVVLNISRARVPPGGFTPPEPCSDGGVLSSGYTCPPPPQPLPSPQVISQLLDVATCTARPQYTMASEAPLLLWRIAYKDPQPAFTYPDEPALGSIASAFGDASEEALLRGALTHTMRATLLDDAAAASAGAHGGGQTPAKSKRAYVPLLQRASMASVAERAEQHERREARKRGRAGEAAPGGTTLPAE